MAEYRRDPSSFAGGAHTDADFQPEFQWVFIPPYTWGQALLYAEQTLTDPTPFRRRWEFWMGHQEKVIQLWRVQGLDCGAGITSFMRCVYCPVMDIECSDRYYDAVCQHLLQQFQEAGSYEFQMRRVSDYVERMQRVREAVAMIRDTNCTMGEAVAKFRGITKEQVRREFRRQNQLNVNATPSICQQARKAAQYLLRFPLSNP